MTRTYQENADAYWTKASDIKEIFDMFGWEKARSAYKDLKFSFSVRHRGRRVVFRIFNNLGDPCAMPDPWSTHSTEECDKAFVAFLNGGCTAYTTLDEKYSVYDLPVPDGTAEWTVPKFKTVEELKLKLGIAGGMA